MVETAQLRQRLGRDVFDYQQLVSCLSHLSKPRDKINRLLNRGDVVRIRKGLYVFGPAYRRDSLARELLANLIYGPSYISLEYALSYWGLIPERVSTVTSVALGRSRKFDTPLGAFTYRSLSPASYAVGADLVESPVGNFLIACAEKALADKVWTDKRFTGTRLSDFPAYIEEDLRIDLTRLVDRDRSRCERIQRAYGSKKTGNLFRFLDSL
ncbi:MAG: type IV toxin-antitoxin system AbiEi family antitoxin domain-containing protein [Planctomycetota bacterium]